MSIWPSYLGHKCLADVLEIPFYQLETPAANPGVTPPPTNVPGRTPPHRSIDMSRSNSNNAEGAGKHGAEQATLSSSLEHQHGPGSPASGTLSLARSRFLHLVHKEIRRRRRQEFIDEYKKMPVDKRKAIIDDYKRYKSVSRTAPLKSKLKTLNPSKLTYDHGALVRFLQFSPDGKFLATSR